MGRKVKELKTQSTSALQHVHDIIPCFSTALFSFHVCRGNLSLDGAGLGKEKPAELNADDDEFDAFRKRMMLAYRFRPNPLVI